MKTDAAWAARRKIVLKQPPTSIETLRDRHKADRTSLGLVKPKEVKDLIIEPAAAEWKAKWKAGMEQLRLFGPQQKPLDKVPFKFKYLFTCDDPRCTGHRMMIEDWEVGQLYFNELKRLGDPKKAAASVRLKFLDELCGSGKDTHFFVGTVWKYNTWIILGVFWPPKEAQRGKQKKVSATASLFDE